MSDIHTLMREAIDKRLRQDFDGAKSILLACIEAHPNAEWPRIELANIFSLAGAFEAQEQTIVEGVGALQSAPILKTMLGELRRKQGRESEAGALFVSSLADRPNPPAFSGLLALEVAAGRLAAAEEIADRALRAFNTKDQHFAFLIEYCSVLGAQYADRVNVDTPTKRGRAISNAVVVSMAKDEGDIIGHQLERCHLVGLRYFLILNNRSSDNTVDEIRRFEARHSDVVLIIIDDPCEAYFQSEKTTLVAQYAEKYFTLFGHPVEWIFPLDADEFVVVPPEGPDLVDILEDATKRDKKLLSFLMNNGASADVLQRLPETFDVDNLFSLKAPFEPRFVGKVAFRPAPGFVIAQGNHAVFGVVERGSEVLHMAQYGAFLRHFPNRSIEQMRSKFTNGARALQASPNIVGGAHWRSNYNKLLQEGDSFLRRLLAAQATQYKNRLLKNQ